MGREVERCKKRKFLYFSVFVNLGLLLVFKYLGVLSQMVHDAVSFFGLSVDSPVVSFLLPIGVSFYIFQSLSYSIDVYKGSIGVERHLGRFAVYVSFFPQLLAGPIERASHLLPQFNSDVSFDVDRVLDGLKPILLGVFMKIVVADRIAPLVDAVYSDPFVYVGAPLVVATYLFSFQIYCDFAGYSLMAVGLAQMFGIDIIDNFRRPFFATSVSDFWKRWHISLVRWFNDYLYYPLGGYKVKPLRWVLNILGVFLVIGFWHGADPKYLVWGLLNGFYLTVPILLYKPRYSLLKSFGFLRCIRVPVVVKRLVVFHLFSLSIVFIKVKDLSAGLHILRNFHVVSDFPAPRVFGLTSYMNLYLAVFFVFVLVFIEVLQKDESFRFFLAKRHVLVRLFFYSFLMLVIYLFGFFEEKPFIYYGF
ncbi:MAG: MBOAT family protein [Candidatus Altiarchaeota archaeon]|nr:MBOAT family protein [Candidatus Altiarchaeota archaeon]